MKTLVIAFLFFSARSFAQSDTLIRFDRTVIQAEDHWVILAGKATDTAFRIGFIYMDNSAGLTLDLGGTFTFRNGNAVLLPEEKDMILKVRLQHRSRNVAFIPAKYAAQLKLPAQPEWLAGYKVYDSASPSVLVKLGNIYNDYEEGYKALKYLEKAQQTNPHFKGLDFELAFAYNITEQYEKAKAIAASGIKQDPASCLLYKEWAYACLHSNDLTGAESVFAESEKNCTNKEFNAETAFNLASTYYMKKDKDKANYWIDITRKNATEGGYISKMAKRLEETIISGQ